MTHILNSTTLADFEAMSPEAREGFLRSLVAFWQENARQQDERDYRKVGTIPSYRWGE